MMQMREAVLNGDFGKFAAFMEGQVRNCHFTKRGTEGWRLD
jgi:hypothetical protein